MAKYLPSHTFQPPPLPADASPTEELEWRLAWDFEWVCSNLIRIRSKDAKWIPLVWNAPQRVNMWFLQEQERRLEAVRQWVLKGRQLGISTLHVNRIGWKAAFHGHDTLCLPQKESPGRIMVRKFEEALKRFPTVSDAGRPISYVPKPTKHLKGDIIEFEQGSLVRESGENKDAGVSQTFQDAHLTEMPLWADADHTMAGFLPTIPYDNPDTSVVCEFTARGEGDYTHQRWLDAEAGHGPFWAVFLPWYWHTGEGNYQRPVKESDAPLSTEEREFMEEVAEIGYEYPLVGESMELIPRLRQKWAAPHRPVPADLAVGYELTMEQMMFRRDMIKAFRGDVDKWNREFPHTPSVAFQSANRRLVPPSVMTAHDRKVAGVQRLDRGEYEVKRSHGGRARRVFRVRDDGRVWRWEKPRAGAWYVIDADTSSGVGADSSAAHVLRVEYRQVHVVASFKGMVRPHDFARILARMGSHYRTMARFTEDTLIDLGKPSKIVVERNHHGEHVIHELVETLGYRNLYRHDDRGKRDNWRKGHDYGFPVYKNTKMKMLLNMSQMLFDDEVTIPCDRTRQEVRNMVYLDDEDSKAGAPRGAHDDMAMSFGEGLWVASSLGVFRRELRKSG